MCEEYTNFKYKKLYGEWSSYKRCEKCGISENDFYIKTENKLWKK